MIIEAAITFQCGSDELIGIIHQPEGDFFVLTGVLIVVGGPQYRVGSHRQFVQLARDLADSGIPVMRFDYRGMGDSEGDQISFEETCPDIKSAIEAFIDHCPGIQDIVLWGLCDAASASLMYSISDDRVKGMILANPWVRTDAGIAKTHLKHYYTARFFEKEFWFKILKFQFEYGKSIRSLCSQIKDIIFSIKNKVHKESNEELSFQEKMEVALVNYTGKILFIISGNDLTAAEFKDMINYSKNWKKKIKAKNIDWYDIEDADHTFSRKKWKAQVSELTIKWIQML